MNQQMFVIVDPINPSNNTARNSFRTPDVLQSFRAAFRSLKSLVSKQYSSAQQQASSENAAVFVWGGPQVLGEQKVETTGDGLGLRKK